MRLLRVGYLAAGLATIAVPALAQEATGLFAPAPQSLPAPLLTAKIIPVMRAALTEAQQPLARSTPEIRGTFSEPPCSRPNRPHPCPHDHSFGKESGATLKRQANGGHPLQSAPSLIFANFGN
jgi:hypothetical protein